MSIFISSRHLKRNWHYHYAHREASLKSKTSSLSPPLPECVSLVILAVWGFFLVYPATRVNHLSALTHRSCKRRIIIVAWGPGVLRSVAAKGGKATRKPGTLRLVPADRDREPLKQHVSLLHSAKPLARHRQPGVNGSPSLPREGWEVAQGRADAYHTAVSWTQVIVTTVRGSSLPSHTHTQHIRPCNAPAETTRAQTAARRLHAHKLRKTFRMQTHLWLRFDVFLEERATTPRKISVVLS